MSDADLKKIERVVIAGCGDSHMAGVATELAFEQIAGVPTESFTAMMGARYASPYIVPNTLALSVSVSGAVSRTREALLQFGRYGAKTVAITATPDSPLAKVASIVLDCTVPSYPEAPGVINYRVSLLMLWLIAIRLAEVKGRLSASQADAVRAELKATADAVEATYKANLDKAKALAEKFKNQKSYVFTSQGPDYASALFGAAKIIEAAGGHAMGQDTEEWAHLQYFTIMDRDMPTFMIDPGYRGHSRAAEIFAEQKRLGRNTIAIVRDDDKDLAPIADVHLPLVGMDKVREAFTPMVSCVPAELFAAFLSDTTGNVPFRRSSEGADAGYAEGNSIRTSKVEEDIKP